MEPIAGRITQIGHWTKLLRCLSMFPIFVVENHVFIEGFLSSGIETPNVDSLTQSHLFVGSVNKIEASFY